MYYDKLIKDLSERVEGMRKSQSDLDGELLYTETWLDQLIDNMDSVNRNLKQAKSGKVSSEPEPVSKKVHMSEEDFKTQLEKLLEGSLEHLGDRISDKILNMLREVKETSGLTRVRKIKEFKEIAESELVDMSKLFLHEKLESNIEQIGVEEKESMGIDKSLKKLREMKEDKGEQSKGS